MSGNATNLPIQLTMNGMPEAEAGFARVRTAGTRAFTDISTEANKATGVLGRAGQAIGSFGYQAQDAAVQIQMGTNALTVLAQQGSQFLGVFGTGGAIAGAALAIGAVTYQLLAGKDAAEQLNEAGKKSDAVFKALEQSADRYTASIDKQRDALVKLAAQIAVTDTADREYQLRQAERAGTSLQSSLTAIRRSAENAISYLPDAKGMAAAQAAIDATNRMRSATGQAAVAIDPGLITLQKAAEEFRASSPDDIEAIQKMAGALDQVAKSGGEAASRAKSWLEALDKGYPDARRAIDELAKNKDLQDLLRGQTPLALGSAPDAPGPDAAADATKAAKEASKARTEAARAAREQAAADKDALGEVTALNKEQNAQFDRYQAQQREIFDNSQRTIEGYKETLTYMEREGDLVSSNADMRGRELAILKERQALQKQGVTDEEQIAERLKLVGEIYDKQLDFTQRKNSFDELARVGEQAFDRIGSAITEAFVQGKGRAVDFGNVTKAVLSEIAQAALRMAIVNPALNAVFGGTRGTVGGLMGSTALSGGGNLAITNGDGGIVGYVQQGAQAYSAYKNLSGASLNPGTYMSGAYNWAGNGVVSGIDSTFGTGIGNWLNTPVGGSSSSLAMGPTGTETLAGAQGLGTYGSYAAGALGIAGGLYGAYAGIQRGGVGGYTSAAGGAVSAGLSAAAMYGMSVPVYGWIAAAALMVLGALLPGQKPSDRTGTATFRTNEPGVVDIGGLTGDRYSAENRAQAQSIGTELGKLADQIGQVTALGRSVETAYRVEVGARDGLNVYFGQDKLHGGLDEEGIKAVTTAFASRMLALAAEQTQDENIRSILGRSGNADPDATLANLSWYENTWKVMQEPLEQTRSGLEAFEAQLEQLKAPFQEVIDKSISLGLATGELAKRQQEAVDYARGQVAQGYDQASWEAQGRGYITTLRGIRENYETNSSLYRSAGRNPEDLYNQQAIAALSQLTVDALRDVATNFVGWDDAMASLAQQMLANTEATEAATAATEAAAQQAQYREQAQGNVTSVLGGITEFIQSMQLGDSSVLSPQAKLALASQQFGDVAGRAATGDYDALSRFTNAGQNLLSAGRDYYGSSAGYGDIQRQVLTAAESIANVSPDALTESAMANIMRDSTKSMVDAIRELQAEVQLLRMENRALAGVS